MPYDAEEAVESVPEPIKLRRFDLRGFARVLFWGASAAAAVTIVAGTAFSDGGAERLKQAVASVIEPMKPIDQPAGAAARQNTKLEEETHQLAQAVRELSADRERLKGRIAILERSVDDITGTVKKHAAQLAAREQPKEVAKPAAATVTSVAPPPTIAATANPPAEKATAAPEPTITASVPAMERTPAASAPAVAEPVPLPPTRMAAVTADPGAEAAVVTTRQIGVDVGGAPTMEALRAHWAALKANAGPDLVGVKPSFAAHRKTSGAVDYRLVLGRLPNSAAALRLCAKLAAARVACHPGMFVVEELTDPQ